MSVEPPPTPSAAAVARMDAPTLLHEFDAITRAYFQAGQEAVDARATAAMWQDKCAVLEARLAELEAASTTEAVSLSTSLKQIERELDFVDKNNTLKEELAEWKRKWAAEADRVTEVLSTTQRKLEEDRTACAEKLAAQERHVIELERACKDKDAEVVMLQRQVDQREAALQSLRAELAGTTAHLREAQAKYQDAVLKGPQVASGPIASQVDFLKQKVRALQDELRELRGSKGHGAPPATKRGRTELFPRN